MLYFLPGVKCVGRLDMSGCGSLHDYRVSRQTLCARKLITFWYGVLDSRDEDVFPDPDRFDIRRSPNPQVAYGYATHECIAMTLALVELEYALSGLFEKLPGLKLAVPKSELQWSDPKGDVGLVKLPVEW